MENQKRSSDHFEQTKPPASVPELKLGDVHRSLFVEHGSQAAEEVVGEHLVQLQEKREDVSDAVGPRLAKVEESVALMSERLADIDANMTKKLGSIMAALGVREEAGKVAKMHLILS